MSNEKWRNWEVPYLPNGSVLWENPNRIRPGMFKLFYKCEHNEIQWFKNEPFEAALCYKNIMHAGGTTSKFVFENTETGAQYVMRLQDFETCLMNGAIVYGVILGRWRFRRDSGHYSIVPYELLSTNDFQRASNE